MTSWVRVAVRFAPLALAIVSAVVIAMRRLAHVQESQESAPVQSSRSCAKKHTMSGVYTGRTTKMGATVAITFRVEPVAPNHLSITADIQLAHLWTRKRYSCRPDTAFFAQQHEVEPGVFDVRVDSNSTCFQDDDVRVPLDRIFVQWDSNADTALMTCDVVVNRSTYTMRNVVLRGDCV